MEKKKRIDSSPTLPHQWYLSTKKKRGQKQTFSIDVWQAEAKEIVMNKTFLVSIRIRYAAQGTHGTSLPATSILSYTFVFAPSFVSPAKKSREKMKQVRLVSLNAIQNAAKMPEMLSTFSTCSPPTLPPRPSSHERAQASEPTQCSWREDPIGSADVETHRCEKWAENVAAAADVFLKGTLISLSSEIDYGNLLVLLVRLSLSPYNSLFASLRT